MIFVTDAESGISRRSPGTECASKEVSHGVTLLRGQPNEPRKQRNAPLRMLLGHGYRF